jgi:hypothetical protein
VVRTTSPAVAPGNRTTSSPRRRPDPRPMRLAFAAGGAAALSALLALIGSAALPATAAVPAATTASAVGGANDVAQVRHIVRYVTLAPGQLPPAGATRTPSTVVAAPIATPQPRPRPVVVTSQSGRP